jgi:ankyrin repeat protein
MKKIFTFLAALGLTGFMMTILVPGAGAQFSDTHHLLNAVADNEIADARGRLFNGANPNARRGADTALIMAVREKYYEMMRLLLEHGAYPNGKSLPDQATAVMIASSNGDETALALLLEFGADVNLTDKQGRTPLMKAASTRKSRVVRILIENGADIFATDYTGRDALQYAREGRARSVIKILEEAGVD